MKIAALAIAFTGHRTYQGVAQEQLMATLRELYGRGFRDFMSGMALGFDLAAAESVLAMRELCPGMRLICVVPFRGQECRFSQVDKQRYAQILSAADQVTVLSEHYTPDCYLRRNDFLIDHAAFLVAWYDGTAGGTRYTVQHARHRGLELVNLYADPQQRLPGL